jgi:hypothetical protein
MRAGIFTEISAEVEIQCDVAWLKRYRVGGIVIWPRMMFSEPAGDIPEWLFRHELQHVYQIVKHGPFLFYLKYFYYSLRYGYHRNPFEVEARASQDIPLTAKERELLWKLRNGSTPQQSD